MKEPVVGTEVSLKEDLRKHNLNPGRKKNFSKSKVFCLGKILPGFRQECSHARTCFSRADSWESLLWGLPFRLPSSEQVEGPQPPSPTPSRYRHR